MIDAPGGVGSAAAGSGASVGAVELADVQGLILRGYTMAVGRHIALRVREPHAARRLLGGLADGARSVPVITSAQPWAVKPDCTVNIGLTHPGLAALGVSPDSLASFPDEFVRGAAARADKVGDAGASAPEHWWSWLADPGVHLVLLLFAQSPAALEATTSRLARAWARGCVELGRQDGAWLPDGVGHFGYRDGISQPVIEGGAADGPPDPLPRAPVGEFLLGYPSQHENFSYPVPTPAALGHNGSFAALRVLAQDVDNFAQFLTERAADTGLSTEFLAAKLCGRWRNGVPLALSPDTDTPDPPLPPDSLNDFDYARPVDDGQGLRCPIGSHIRRMFPRGQRVAGDGATQHRLVRRGIPYGPAYDPARPRDGVDRGLLGLFIGVSLRDQFEFVMANWANDGTFTAGLGHTQDPLLGGHDAPATSTFEIPRPGGPVVLDGLARFVTTRAGLYCFLPSRTALRYLAGLGGGVDTGAGVGVGVG